MVSAIQNAEAVMFLVYVLVLANALPVFWRGNNVCSNVRGSFCLVGKAVMFVV